MTEVTNASFSNSVRIVFLIAFAPLKRKRSMYQPETYGIALLFMILSMLCWGSWANSMKLCPGYRFQLLYWDYVIGLIAGAVLWGVTLGSVGTVGRSFFADIAHSGIPPILLAMAGGAIFNIANLLLVAAIDIAGLAVAFPVGIGLALIVGAVSTYIISPKGNPILLFCGIALVTAAIVFEAEEDEVAVPAVHFIEASAGDDVAIGEIEQPFDG